LNEFHKSMALPSHPALSPTITAKFVMSSTALRILILRRSATDCRMNRLKRALCLNVSLNGGVSSSVPIQENERA
ncbi:hypothetical protein, partial [Klebsiella quasipneumoniae]|uniref:hypothetical protein n=1 Tax=Klebsiella quasipneumoniae TaxID=1463165 RepID=UPI001D12127F